MSETVHEEEPRGLSLAAARAIVKARGVNGLLDVLKEEPSLIIREQRVMHTRALYDEAWKGINEVVASADDITASPAQRLANAIGSIWALMADPATADLPIFAFYLRERLSEDPEGELFEGFYRSPEQQHFDDYLYAICTDAQSLGESAWEPRALTRFLPIYAGTVITGMSWNGETPTPADLEDYRMRTVELIAANGRD